MSMVGKCDSCGRLYFGLITQTNYAGGKPVTRKMCHRCCVAANEVDRLMCLSPSQKAELRNDALGLQMQEAFKPKKAETVPANWLELYLKDDSKS